MGAYFDFTIKLKGTEEVKKPVVEELIEFLGESCVTDEEDVFSESWLDLHVEDDVKDFVLKLIRLSPDIEFEVKSTIDTSEQAGEYMNYLFVYEDHTLTIESSSWYLYASDLDIEEYNEENGTSYTDDDFERFANEEWFVLSSGYGEIVEEVPYEDVEEMTLEEILEQ